MILLVQADARHIPLADNTVQCVVTSPPYWGLRKYAGEQELIWGGADGCKHEYHSAGTSKLSPQRDNSGGLVDNRLESRGEQKWTVGTTATVQHGGTCLRCGAWRGSYGLEPTIEMYVAHTVEILREIRRVLRSDGVMFLNLGDSYAGGGNYRGVKQESTLSAKQRSNGGARGVSQELGVTRDRMSGMKPKDLCLIPQRVALAAQADGWWVRSMIVWAKPNPMPESVTDRPTDAYEHIIMLTKSARYYWNMEAVSEPVSPNTHLRISQNVAEQIGSQRVPGKTNGNMKAVVRGGVNPKAKACGKNSRMYQDRDPSHPADRKNRQNESFTAAISGPKVLTRNLRNVWTFATQPYSGAHFATFPEELPRRCILAASKVGDLVLDPFGGSGTTGKVAVELRRKAVLLDLAYGADYAALAKKRTTNVQLEAFA